MSRSTNALLAMAMATTLSQAGCGVGLSFFTDFGSISMGTFNRGALRRGKKLPPKGEGYVVPPLWANRGNQHGTEELVLAIQRAARRVRREYPGGTLGVGDLSPRGGGGSEHHQSHANGRDADLIFFAVDEKNRPVAPVNAMPRYGPDLASRPTPGTTPGTGGVQYGPYSPRRFDVKRNWALVRALVTDPAMEVQYLFCHRALREALLAHARSIGEDAAILDKADALLHQPGDSAPHDDHLHLRVYCAANDRVWGCLDRGPVRWWKKRYKYLPPFFTDTSELMSRLAVVPYPMLRGFIP